MIHLPECVKRFGYGNCFNFTNGNGRGSGSLNWYYGGNGRTCSSDDDNFTFGNGFWSGYGWDGNGQSLFFDYAVFAPKDEGE